MVFLWTQTGQKVSNLVLALERAGITVLQRLQDHVKILTGIHTTSHNNTGRSTQKHGNVLCDTPHSLDVNIRSTAPAGYRMVLKA